MKYLIILLCLFSFNNSQAQKKKNVYSLDINEKVTTNKEDIAFYRVIEEPDSGSTYFKMTEYYKNGQIKRIANLFNFEPFIVYGEGTVLCYYPNGAKKSSEFRTHLKQDFKNFHFYPNGKHKETNSSFVKAGTSTFKTEQVSDTSGVDFLDERGNGNVLTNDFDGIETKGKYRKGYKIGLWTYKNNADGSIVRETYKNDTLFLGENTTKEGIIYNYKFELTYPSTNLIDREKRDKSFLGSNFEFSTDILDKKGIVKLLFDLTEEGEIKDLKVYRSLSELSDEKAINIVKNKKWYPAKLKGKPIDSYLVQTTIYFQ
jgi:antitoxin component YwqK of YwqJK toxin-antitoxin module